MKSIDGNKLSANIYVNGRRWCSDYDEFDYFSVDRAVMHNLRALRKEDGGALCYAGTRVNEVFDSEALKESTLANVQGVIGRIIRGELNISQLEKYFKDDVIINICANRHDENVTKILIDGLVAAACDKLIHDNLNNFGSWITNDPGTQLTGSFNPITIDAKTWYSDYYLEKLPAAPATAPATATVIVDDSETIRIRNRLKDLATQIHEAYSSAEFNGQNLTLISAMAIQLIELQTLDKYDNDVYHKIGVIDAGIRIANRNNGVAVVRRR